MKTLSKLIRDVAEPGFWRAEVQRTAEASGHECGQDLQAAWGTVSEVLDSIIVLAFEYRHRDEEFPPALKEWHGFLRQRLKSDGDLGKDRAESTVLWRLLGKIESTYEQFEFDRSRADALRLVNPQRLDASSAQYAREVSAHLKKAAAKVRRIQRTTETSKFEMEIYRSILESAIQHFDEMSESNAAATLREAA
jgi:hypothetical protein